MKKSFLTNANEANLVEDETFITCRQCHSAHKYIQTKPVYNNNGQESGERICDACRIENVTSANKCALKSCSTPLNRTTKFRALPSKFYEIPDGKFKREIISYFGINAETNACCNLCYIKITKAALVGKSRFINDSISRLIPPTPPTDNNTIVDEVCEENADVYSRIKFRRKEGSVTNWLHKLGDEHKPEAAINDSNNNNNSNNDNTYHGDTGNFFDTLIVPRNQEPDDSNDSDEYGLTIDISEPYEQPDKDIQKLIKATPCTHYQPEENCATPNIVDFDKNVVGTKNNIVNGDINCSNEDNVSRKTNVDIMEIQQENDEATAKTENSPAYTGLQLDYSCCKDCGNVIQKRGRHCMGCIEKKSNECCIVLNCKTPPDDVFLKPLPSDYFSLSRIEKKILAKKFGLRKHMKKACQNCYDIISFTLNTCFLNNLKKRSYTMCQKCQRIVPEASTTTTNSVYAGGCATIVECLNCLNNTGVRPSGTTKKNSDADGRISVKKKKKNDADAKNSCKEKKKLDADKRKSDKGKKKTNTNEKNVDKEKKKSDADAKNSCKEKKKPDVIEKKKDKEKKKPETDTENSDKEKKKTDADAENSCNEKKRPEIDVKDSDTKINNKDEDTLTAKSDSYSINEITTKDPPVNVKPKLVFHHLNRSDYQVTATFKKAKSLSGRTATLKAGNMKEVDNCLIKSCISRFGDTTLYSYAHIWDFCSLEVANLVIKNFQLDLIDVQLCCYGCFTELKWYIAFLNDDIIQKDKDHVEPKVKGKIKRFYICEVGECKYRRDGSFKWLYSYNDIMDGCSKDVVAEVTRKYQLDDTGQGFCCHSCINDIKLHIAVLVPHLDNGNACAKVINENMKKNVRILPKPAVDHVYLVPIAPKPTDAAVAPTSQEINQRSLPDLSQTITITTDASCIGSNDDAATYPVVGSVFCIPKGTTADRTLKTMEVSPAAIQSSPLKNMDKLLNEINFSMAIEQNSNVEVSSSKSACSNVTPIVLQSTESRNVPQAVLQDPKMVTCSNVVIPLSRSFRQLLPSPIPKVAQKGKYTFHSCTLPDTRTAPIMSFIPNNQIFIPALQLHGTAYSNNETVIMNSHIEASKQYFVPQKPLLLSHTQTTRMIYPLVYTPSPQGVGLKSFVTAQKPSSIVNPPVCQSMNQSQQAMLNSQVVVPVAYVAMSQSPATVTATGGNTHLQIVKSVPRYTLHEINSTFLKTPKQSTNKCIDLSQIALTSTQFKIIDTVLNSSHLTSEEMVSVDSLGSVTTMSITSLLEDSQQNSSCKGNTATVLRQTSVIAPNHSESSGPPVNLSFITTPKSISRTSIFMPVAVQSRITVGNSANCASISRPNNVVSTLNLSYLTTSLTVQPAMSACIFNSSKPAYSSYGDISEMITSAKISNKESYISVLNSSQLKTSTHVENSCGRGELISDQTTSHVGQCYSNNLHDITVTSEVMKIDRIYKNSLHESTHPFDQCTNTVNKAEHFDKTCQSEFSYSTAYSSDFSIQSIMADGSNKQSRECQTNFIYSNNSPNRSATSVNSVLKLDKICQTGLVYLNDSRDQCTSTNLKEPYTILTDSKLKNAVRKEAKDLFAVFMNRLNGLTLGCGKELLSELTHPKEVSIVADYERIIQDYGELYKNTDRRNMKERLRLLSAVALHASNDIIRVYFRRYTTKGDLISVNQDEIKQARDYARQFGPGFPLPPMSDATPLRASRTSREHTDNNSQNLIIPNQLQSALLDQVIPSNTECSINSSTHMVSDDPNILPPKTGNTSSNCEVSKSDYSNNDKPALPGYFVTLPMDTEATTIVDLCNTKKSKYHGESSSSANSYLEVDTNMWDETADTFSPVYNGREFTKGGVLNMQTYFTDVENDTLSPQGFTLPKTGQSPLTQSDRLTSISNYNQIDPDFPQSTIRKMNQTETIASVEELVENRSKKETNIKCDLISTGMKRKRTKFTEEERDILEGFYLNIEKYGKKKCMEDIKNVLKLDKRTIDTWFKNRNSKEKKEELGRNLKNMSLIDEDINELSTVTSEMFGYGSDDGILYIDEDADYDSSPRVETNVENVAASSIPSKCTSIYREENQAINRIVDFISKMDDSVSFTCHTEETLVKNDTFAISGPSGDISILKETSGKNGSNSFVPQVVETIVMKNIIDMTEPSGNVSISKDAYEKNGINAFAPQAKEALIHENMDTNEPSGNVSISKNVSGNNNYTSFSCESQRSSVGKKIFDLIEASRLISIPKFTFERNDSNPLTCQGEEKSTGKKIIDPSDSSGYVPLPKDDSKINDLKSFADQSDKSLMECKTMDAIGLHFSISADAFEKMNSLTDQSEEISMETQTIDAIRPLFPISKNTCEKNESNSFVDQCNTTVMASKPIDAIGPLVSVSTNVCEKNELTSFADLSTKLSTENKVVEVIEPYVSISKEVFEKNDLNSFANQVASTEKEVLEDETSLIPKDVCQTEEPSTRSKITDISEPSAYAPISNDSSHENSSDSFAFQFDEASMENDTRASGELSEYVPLLRGISETSDSNSFTYQPNETHTKRKVTDTCGLSSIPKKYKSCSGKNNLGLRGNRARKIWTSPRRLSKEAAEKMSLLRDFVIRVEKINPDDIMYQMNYFSYMNLRNAKLKFNDHSSFSRHLAFRRKSSSKSALILKREPICDYPVVSTSESNRSLNVTNADDSNFWFSSSVEKVDLSSSPDISITVVYNVSCDNIDNSISIKKEPDDYNCEFETNSNILNSTDYILPSAENNESIIVVHSSPSAITSERCHQNVFSEYSPCSRTSRSRLVSSVKNLSLVMPIKSNINQTNSNAEVLPISSRSISPTSTILPASNLSVVPVTVMNETSNIIDRWKCKIDSNIVVTGDPTSDIIGRWKCKGDNIVVTSENFISNNLGTSTNVTTERMSFPYSNYNYLDIKKECAETSSNLLNQPEFISNVESYVPSLRQLCLVVLNSSNLGHKFGSNSLQPPELSPHGPDPPILTRHPMTNKSCIRPVNLLPDLIPSPYYGIKGPLKYESDL